MRESLEKLMEHIKASESITQSLLDSLPSTPINIVNVNPGDNVNAAILSMADGGTISCAPGQYGTLDFPDFEHQPILIETKNYERSGLQPSAADKSRMAMFGISVARNKSHNFMFKNVGFETTTNTVGQFVLGGAKNVMTDLSQVPYGYSFEHTLHLGNKVTRRGISANCKFLLVDASFFDDFGQVGNDSQAICGWNGAIDHSIINCKLAAASENILYGGSDSANTDMRPGAVRLVGCDLYKKQEWVGKTLNVKCIVELKNIIGFTMERCKIHGCWADAWPYGLAIAIKASNQENTNPDAQSSNVVMTNNEIYDVGNYFLIIGRDDGPYTSGICRNIQITQNYMHSMHNLGDGRALKFGDSPQEILVAHNTILANRHSFVEVWNPETLSAVMRDNIMLHGNYGVHPSIPAGLQLLNNAVEIDPDRKITLPPTNVYYPTGTFSTTVENGYAKGALLPHVTSDGQTVGRNI